MQDVPGDDKLQVSRECLDSLARNFKTYQPMLCAIKADYEQALDERARVARKVAPLEAQLDAMRCQHETIMISMERDYASKFAAQDSALQSANRKVVHLEVNLDRAKNYREECSSRMAEVDEQLGHLQITLAFQARNSLHVTAVNESAQVELREARSQVNSYQKSTHLLKKEMKTMVPASKLHDSEISRLASEDKLQLAEERIAVLEASIKSLQQAYDTISSEHGAIKGMYIKLLHGADLGADQRAKAFIELNDSAISAELTPRPEWGALEGSIRDDLSGSTEQRVRQLSSILQDSQNQLAFLRLQVDSSCAFWQPLTAAAPSVNEEMLPLLKFNEPVRNLHLTMKQVEDRVVELWNFKIDEPDDELKKLSMAEYIESSFDKKNIPATNRAELMYNLYHGLAKWGGASPELQLFRHVLEGKTEESVYWAAEEIPDRVASTATFLRDAADRDLLTLEDIHGAVRSVCPVKREVDLTALGHVLDAGVDALGGWEDLIPSNLSGADPEPLIEPYRRMLRAQWIRERDEHLSELRLQLETVAFGAFVEQMQDQAAQRKKMIVAKLNQHKELEKAALFSTQSRPGAFLLLSANFVCLLLYYLLLWSNTLNNNNV